jgi:hypothetical protein
MPVTEHDPRQRLDLERQHGGVLRLGEAADLGLRELDSATVCGSSAAMHASISAAERRKAGGLHRSNVREHSRTAASP